MPSPLAPGLVFTVSAAAALVLTVYYPIYKYTGFKLVTQQPFTDWSDVKNLYYGLVGQSFAPRNLTQSLMHTAWCDHPSYRPNIVPSNRSDACACLYAANQNFLNGSNGTCAPAACTAAGDAAIGCLRDRGVWTFYDAGSLNPIVLALTCNAALMMTSMACLMAVCGVERLYIWIAVAVPALFFTLYLLILAPLHNFLFVAALLGIVVAVAVGLDEELESIATCAWFCFPLTVALLASYLAVAHTVRDLVAILCISTLGYLAGLLAQRVYWTRTVSLEPALHAWIVQSLAVGQAGLWLALFVLADTNWLANSPFLAAGASLGLLCVACAMGAIELLAGTAWPDAWVDPAQVSLLVLVHLLFAVFVVLDAGTG
jgi:hypothetical protein